MPADAVSEEAVRALIREQPRIPASRIAQQFGFGPAAVDPDDPEQAGL